MPWALLLLLLVLVPELQGALEEASSQEEACQEGEEPCPCSA